MVTQTTKEESKMEGILSNRLTKIIAVICIAALMQLTLIDLVYALTSTKPNVSGPYGTNVNSYTGNLFYQRTDLYIPGRGLTIDITFSYNSGRTARDWGYGQGWSFPYSMQYYFENSSVIIERSDGRKDEFVWNGSSYDPPTGVYDQLTEYQSDKYLLTTKHGKKYYFDNATHKQITKIEDKNGNTLTFSYTSGKLTTITDPSGRQLNLSWTGDHLTQITDPNKTPNRVISYQYDAADNMTQVTDPVGNTTSYGYGSWSNITSITDARSNTVNISYNANKAISGISTATTNKTFTYDTGNHTTTVTDYVTSGNQTRIYTYDTDGRVTGIQLPSGHTISYTWDSNDNIMSYNDANSVTTNCTYDSKGNMLTKSDPIGTITYTYESTYNQIASINDKNSNTTTYSYDANGNLTTVNAPLGKTTNYTSNSYGQRTGMTDDNSHTTSYGYNSNSDLTSISHPIGSESFTYDNVGNLLTDTDPNSSSITFTYDNLNRVTSMKDAYNHGPSFSYDANGNMTGKTDANGNITTYTYNAMNRLTNVSTTAGNTSYTYDAMDNLTSINDANGHTTNFTYNNLNLVASETDPAGNTTSYTYDGNGNLLTRTDANGNQTSYTYDADNRLTAKSYAGNSDSYSYDNNGNMTSAGNNDYSFTYSYDALNRLTNKTCTTLGKSISYTYDGIGNRLTMTDPDGGVTTYTNDANDRLISLTNPNSQSNSFIYDTGGRLTRQDNANGTYTTYSYDNADRLTALNNYNSSGTVLSSYDYTYDNAGNRLSMTDKDSSVNSYTYDNMQQVTDVNYADGGTEDFTYDNWGNRTQLVKDGATTNYTYDTADRILTAGAVSYTFDNNGNMTVKTEGANTTTYTYDGENRLTQVTLPDATTNAFTYCPAGLRMSKTNSSGITNYYFYDGFNTIIEMNSSYSTTTRYTSGMNIDEWISMDKSGSYYLYHKDGLGSTTGLTNSSQSLVATYNYDAFGSIRSQTGSVTNPYMFTGRYNDTESDLYFYRTRYYDSEIGRFTTKDHFLGLLEFPLSLNKYGYVNSNPINYIDPQGKFGIILGLVYIAIAYGVGLVLRSRIEDVGRAVASNIEAESASQIAQKTTDDRFIDALIEVRQKAVKATANNVITAVNMPGTFSGGSIPTSGTDIVSTGISGLISLISGGSQVDTQDNPGDDTLPVTLSSFTVEFDNGATILAWATQSETDNIGWNIYRGKNDDNFANATQINNEMITGYGTTSEPHDYIYEDEIEDAIPGDVYWYWLESIDLGGEINHYNVVARLVIPEDYEPSVPPELPIIYGLYQNAPNPFNPAFASRTKVFFNLHNSSFVEINIYNIRGEFVKSIYNDFAEFDDSKPKPKVTYWDGKNENGRLQSTGIYLYELKVNGKVFSTKRLILMR